MLQKWLLRLSSRICFLADSLYFFSLQSGFTLGKWLLSFTQDSSKVSSNLNCFGDQITNKNTKTYTKWLKLLSRVLNMPIELKDQNYYSKVFKRINYRLSNSTFWVVISYIKRGSLSSESTSLTSQLLYMISFPSKLPFSASFERLRSCVAISESMLFKLIISYATFPSGQHPSAK